MERLSCSVQNYAWGKLGKSSTVSQLAEANGDDPDMMEVEPELQKYLRPTSQMTIDLGIN